MFIFTILYIGCTEDTNSNTNNKSDTSDTASVVPYCEQLDFPESIFSTETESARMGNIVSDFTIETTEGPWTFSEEWTGCDSYLFLNYHPDYEYPVDVWNSSFEDLISSSPPNVHYFFTSLNQGSEEVEVTAQQDRFDQELLNLDEEQQEYWLSHFHFVTESMG